jgi:virginiamycin B lyase
MQADQLAHLVVKSTVDYKVSTFQGPAMEGGQPYGVALVGASVYVAQTENDKVSEYTPSTDFWVDVVLPGFDEVDYPYKLATGNSDAVWGTERSGNRITRYTYGTFAVLTSYDLEPVGGAPMGLAVGDSDYLWFTQWGAGQIGTLATQSGDITYYPVPSKRLLPTGIDVESPRVWVVATKPYQVYLPLITRSGE